MPFSEKQDIVYVFILRIPNFYFLRAGIHILIASNTKTHRINNLLRADLPIYIPIPKSIRNTKAPTANKHDMANRYNNSQHKPRHLLVIYYTLG